MSITTDQYNKVLARLTKLELMANDIAVAIDNLASVDQLSQISVLLQTEVQAAKVDIAALENRVTAIEEEPIT